MLLHWLLYSPASWPPLWPSVHLSLCPSLLTEPLLVGGGHEAVLDAEYNEGIVAAHSFLPQQPDCQQGRGLTSGYYSFHLPHLAVAVDQPVSARV